MKAAILSVIVAGILGASLLSAAGAVLARDGYVDEVDRLIDRLRTDRDDGDRERAAKELGRLGAVRAVPALVQALLYDEDDDVREEAAEALGRIGDARALPALRRAAATDDDSSVRREARDAIEQIEPTRVVVVERPRVEIVERPVVVQPYYYSAPSTTVVYRYAPPTYRFDHRRPHGREHDFHGRYRYPSSGVRIGYQDSHWRVGFTYRW